jgi:hypothetical protein
MRIIDAVRTELNHQIAEHLERAARELTQLVRIALPSLEKVCDEDVTYTNFLAMAYASFPRCEILESASDNEFQFKITSPPSASCLGSIIGDDTNADKHIGPNGTTQSNALIGICTTAVMRALGGELLLVDPLSFRSALPLGESALVTIKLHERRQLTLGSIVVVRTSDEKVILRQAKIKMTPRQ